jgi:tRNA G18 (ribose-2'-O)-methylase SpoU
LITAEDYQIIPTLDTDTRNVSDEFKGLPLSQIREILLGRILPFSVLAENVQGDLNLGVMLRTANAFGAREVLYHGRKRFDRRSCVGVQNYTDFHHLTPEQLIALKDIYYIVGFENNHASSVPIQSFDWNNRGEKPILLVFGSEESGIDEQIKAMCDGFVYIEQRGSVRSLNVSSCASIGMFLVSQALGG